MNRSALIAIAAGLLIVGGAVGVLAGRRIGRPPAATEDLVGEMFSGVPTNMQVIISDEGLVIAQYMLGRSCTLQAYEDSTFLSAPEFQEKPLNRLAAQLSKREVGNIGDIQNAIRLNERLHERNREVNIRHARQVHARDFRSGNFIILGGTYGKGRFVAHFGF